MVAHATLHQPILAVVHLVVVLMVMRMIAIVHLLFLHHQAQPLITAQFPVMMVVLIAIVLLNNLVDK